MNSSNAKQEYDQLLAPAGGAWSSGLFDCFDDCTSCWLTFLCPCVAFGQIAEIVDQGNLSCLATGTIYYLFGHLTRCPSLFSFSYRTEIRRRYNLEEEPCEDCLVHLFCEPCALCQEYRELQNRGFDLCLGWEGNVHKQNRRVAMGPVAPAVESGMTR